MPTPPRYFRVLTIVAATTSFILPMGTAHAAKENQPGTHPQPKFYQCAGQLTRPADVVITMEANQTFYVKTIGAMPGTTPPQFDAGYPITAAEAAAKACRRRVIDIHVPSTTSSGCPNCYPNAEINVCAAQFGGSVLFEHHCHVPTASTSLTKCNTFSHAVEVYKKPAGATEFDKIPLQPTPLMYRGVKNQKTGNLCKVYATHLGNIWDTAEAFPNVLPPASGTDVYRVLSLPRFDGADVDTVVFIEFERR